MPRRARAVALLLGIVLALTGCRVDVGVDVHMAGDGSGTITVTLVADQDVVQQAPGLADDLRVTDAERVGWQVTGPTAGDDGSLQVVLRHSFANPDEATALLASLNGPLGPFKSVRFTRTKTDKQLVYTISGAGRVDGGLAAFADASLVTLIGGTPYANDIVNAGLTPTDAIPIKLHVDLPGHVTATGGSQAAGGITWQIPIDGSQIDLGTTTTSSLRRGGKWALASTLLHVALVVWLVLAVLLIGWIAAARHKRRGPRMRRRRRGTGRPPVAGGRDPDERDDLDADDVADGPGPEPVGAAPEVLDPDLGFHTGSIVVRPREAPPAERVELYDERGQADPSDQTVRLDLGTFETDRPAFGRGNRRGLVLGADDGLDDDTGGGPGGVVRPR